MKAHNNYASKFLILITYLALFVLAVPPGRPESGSGSESGNGNEKHTAATVDLGVKFLSDLGRAPLSKVSFGSLVELSFDDCGPEDDSKPKDQKGKQTDQDIKLSDQNLAWYAQQASQEMTGRFHAGSYGVEDPPGMIAVIWKGDNLYIGSSVLATTDYTKSLGYEDWAPPQLKAALDECKEDSKTSKGKGKNGKYHTNYAQCAEVTAAFIAFKNGETILTGATVVAWDTEKQDVAEPCGNVPGQNVWGCNKVLPKLGMRDVKPGVKTDAPDREIEATPTSFTLGIPPSAYGSGAGGSE